MEARGRRIPKSVDDPIPFFLWDPPEFIAAVLILGLSMFLRAMLIGALAAGLLLWIARRMKRGAKRGAVFHAIWKSGAPIDPVLPRYFPPAWLIELIP